MSRPRGTFAFKKGDCVPDWVLSPGGYATFGTGVVVVSNDDGVYVSPERELKKNECVARVNPGRESFVGAPTFWSIEPSNAVSSTLDSGESK